MSTTVERHSLIAGNGGLKPQIFRTRINGQCAIIKDFSTDNVLLKPVVRYLAQREAKLLRQLQHHDHIPRYLGCCTPYTIAMQFIEGCHPGDNCKTIDNEALQRFNVFLQHFHAEGFSHNDLRRKNLIVSRDGELHLIDFGAAFSGGLLPGFLQRRLQQADMYHFLKIRCEMQASTCGEFAKAPPRPFKGLTLWWKHYFR